MPLPNIIITFYILIALLLWAHPWTLPGEIKIPENDLRFTLQPKVTHIFNQNVFVVCRFSDNSILMTSLFGFKTGNGIINQWGIYAVFVDSSGVSTFGSTALKENRLIVSDKRLSVTDGKNFFEKTENGYNLEFLLDTFNFKLYITNALPAWRPANAIHFLTEKKDVYETSTVIVPLGTSSGTIALKDKTINLSGSVCSEFSSFDLPLSKMNPTLIAMRLFSDPEESDADSATVYHLTILEKISHKDFGSKRTARIMVVTGTNAILATDDFLLESTNFKKLPDIPWRYPETLKISCSDRGYKLEGIYSAKELFDVTDIFSKIPRLMRDFLLLFLDRPVNFRSRGVFEGTLTTDKGDVKKIKMYGGCEVLISK